MQKTLYILLLLSLLITPLMAHSGTKIIAELQNLDDLLLISQDLEDEAPVYISVNTKDKDESCFCVCREGTWSCTEVKCEKQNDTCEEEK